VRERLDRWQSLQSYFHLERLGEVKRPILTVLVNLHLAKHIFEVVVKGTLHIDVLELLENDVLSEEASERVDVL